MAFFSFSAAFVVALLVAATTTIASAEQELESEKSESSSILANVKTTEWYLPLIYGKCRVGINVVYAGTSGADNKYLHYVGIIGEGPINGIAQEDGVDQLFLDGKLWTEWGSDYVYYEIFTGSSTQNVCSTLHSAIPEWDDPLRYTAYIYVRLKYDQDKWIKKPDITLTVEGLKLYDPTDEITAYSNNPALATYDKITRSSKRGGIGIASSRMDAPSFDTSKDYCTSKGWTANMVIKEYQAVSDNVQLILNCYRAGIIYSENLFKCRFRDLNEEGGPVMSFTEDDILDSGDISSLKIRPNSDLFSRPNCVNAIFYNAAKKYIEDSLPFPDSTAIDADGDYREREIKLLGLSSLETVQAMAYYYLERWRWGNVAEFSAMSKAMSLEPYDLIDVSHDLAGWDEHLLRVLAPSINAAAEVQLSCIEEKEELYDDTYNPAPSSEWHDTTLPDPLGTVYPVINVSHAEEVYYYRNRSFTRWKIDFDPPAAEDYPFWDYAEIWVKIGSGDYRYMTKSTSDYALDPVEEGETYYVKLRSVSIHGVKEDFDTAYVVSKTIVGKTTLPTDLTAMTAVANGDTVSIFADPIDDPDIQGYEVRLGDAWDGAVFVSFNMNCSLRLVGVRPGTHKFWMSPKDNAGNYSDNPVYASVEVFIPPGFTQLPTYGSWAWDFTTGTFDNAEHTTHNTQDALKCSHTDEELTGIWESPTYDLGAVEKVRIFGDFLHDFSSTDTTWDGVAPLDVEETIDNAAAVDKGGGQVGIPITGHGFSADDVIGISGSKNYNGGYTIISETTDEIVITATYVAETFAGTEKVASGTTWNGLGASGTWDEIFDPTAAGVIRAKLKYSDSDSGWDTADYFDFFEILCAEVECRYVRVEVEITDPTLDANLYLYELNMKAYEGPQ